MAKKAPKRKPSRPKKSVAVLRKIFLKAHWAHEAVHNPEGIRSGERQKRWNERNKALDALVRADRVQSKRQAKKVMADYERRSPEKRPARGYYYHYKHNPKGTVNNYAYYIQRVGHHTEDDCRPVDRYTQVYLPLYEDALVYKDGKMFDVRPLHMFYVPAEWQGQKVQRFTKITDEAVLKELKAIRRKMYPEDFED